jgi:hypothetical protein
MAPHIPGSAKNLQAQILSLFGRLLGRCVLRLDPRDCHTADVVGSSDLDQRFLEARAGTEVRSFFTPVVSSLDGASRRLGMSNGSGGALADASAFESAG